MSNKDIDGLIQKAISKCIDDGEYDPVEDWIVDPALRLCNEALGEAAGELETLRSETARLTAELARVEKERDALRNWPTCVRVSLSMVNPSPGSGRDLYLRCDCPVQDIGYADAGLVVSCPEIESQLTAALTRAKSAEDRCERLTELGRKVVSACYLRTHGFPGGDISDTDFSKLTPAIVALDAELNLTPPGDAGKGGGS